MLFLQFVIILVLSPAPGASGFPVAAKDPLYDELEGAALAEALVRDGKLSDARAVLDGLSPAEAQGSRAEKVRGDLALLAGEPTQAAIHFERALKTSQYPQLYLGLALARQRQGRPDACAEAAAAAGESVYRSEQYVLLKAGCERGAGRPVAAWETLVKGKKAGIGFAAVIDHLRLMLVLGLREEASRAVQDQLLSASSPSEALAMAEAMMEAGAREECLLALETARLRFPYDQDIILAIAPIYFAKGLKRATAETFSLAAVRDRAYAEHAAETLRQVGDRQRSRYLNIFIPGEKERGRQKLALAVESSRWDLVASMDGIVKRSALHGDDEVSYALAYSLLRGEERERALSYLESVTSSGLLQKVSSLMKNISDCAERKWRCL